MLALKLLFSPFHLWGNLTIFLPKVWITDFWTRDHSQQLLWWRNFAAIIAWETAINAGSGDNAGGGGNYYCNNLFPNSHTNTETKESFTKNPSHGFFQWKLLAVLEVPVYTQEYPPWHPWSTSSCEYSPPSRISSSRISIPNILVGISYIFSLLLQVVKNVLLGIGVLQSAAAANVLLPGKMLSEINVATWERKLNYKRINGLGWS